FRIELGERGQIDGLDQRAKDHALGLVIAVRPRLGLDHRRGRSGGGRGLRIELDRRRFLRANRRGRLRGCGWTCTLTEHRDPPSLKLSCGRAWPSAAPRGRAWPC